jgi:ribosomal protein S18 acetylase RimI-like enzyme
MNSHKNKDNHNPDIHISNLELKDLDRYLKIEFDAFYDKLKIMFSNKKEAAFNILKEEISNNIDTGRYYNARSGGITVGIIEIVTKENTRAYSKSFRTYIKYLGFFRAVKAFLFNLFETPKLDSSTIYIDNVAVDIDNRRKGVAKKMLSFVEDYAIKSRKGVLTLWVAAVNNNAHTLYSKSGFYDVVLRSSGMAEKFSGYRDWIYMKKEIQKPN